MTKNLWHMLTKLIDSDHDIFIISNFVLFIENYDSLTQYLSKGNSPGSLWNVVRLSRNSTYSNWKCIKTSIGSRPGTVIR